MSLKAGHVGSEFAVNTKKCLYFIAGAAPTNAETAAVNRLRHRYGTVNILSQVAGSAYYGGTRLVPADALAGSSGSIPSNYTSGISGYADGDVSAFANDSDVNPEALIVIGPTTFAHTGTAQLYAVATQVNLDTDVATPTDVTATNTVWSSSATGVATVGASTGLVTGVAAGSVTITATYTAPGGSAKVATKALTLS